ncbi:hypothetical protein L9F63_000377, partial [Diploptera punctata]
MEPLFSLLFAMGVSSVAELDDNYYDIVGKLPTEIAIMILRNLDSTTLLSASRVSRRWFALCRSDLILKTRVKAEIRRQRIQRITPPRAEINRSTQNVYQPFAALNGLQQRQLTFVR